MTPTCIAGMHRSGTSLVAGLLHLHGLWLGDDADLMPADAHNPLGYFESVPLVQANDEILSIFGGGWCAPPPFPPGWQNDPRLDHAREVIAQWVSRAGDRPWGFKDPRASLTFPFWLAVLGEVRPVVCLRNPVEVARSLHHRDGIELERGLELWRAHYRALLDCTDPSSRVVVEYESLCADPVASAACLLARFSGLAPLNAHAARTFARPTLRHNRATAADLAELGVGGELVVLYEQLLSEAIYRVPAPAGADIAEAVVSETLAGWDQALRDVQRDLTALAAAVSRIETELGFARRADLAGIAAAVDSLRPAAGQPTGLS